MSKLATPLCLPNNCRWNETANEYHSDDDTPRTSLRPVEAALRQLRAIKGPVCVVSIVGPCRRGKSYILSRIFNQGEVFPLGHSLDPETMGMWLWVVPERYRDHSTGQEFTVVLLDSEGTNAVEAEGKNDHSIITLTVLLSSIMIYNSVGVPHRSDVEGLQHIVNLSQRIQVLSDKAVDPSSCRKVFPSFVWLLRDVILQLPKEFKTLREYFVGKVFNHGSSENARKLEENVTKLFRDFDAFQLPPPADNPLVVQNMNAAEEQRELNPEFTRQVKQLQQNVKAKLTPNRSLQGELITGEALSIMVEEHLKTLNTPGSIPCIQSTWQSYVYLKCSEAFSTCLNLYKDEMEKQMKKEDFPCEDEKIRKAHREANLLSVQHFEFETLGMELANTWSYLRDLAEKEEEIESMWLKRNISETEEFYRNREAMLRSQYIEPVLQRVYKNRRDYDIVPTQLYSVYDQVKDQFGRPRKGPKALYANLVHALKEKLTTEMRENLDMLLRLKKRDDDLRSEKLALQFEREEAVRLQGENTSMVTELKEKEERIAALERQHILDQERALQKFETKMKDEREELENVLIEQRRQSEREREALSRQRRDIEATMRDRQRMFDEQEQNLARLRADFQRKKR